MLLIFTLIACFIVSRLSAAQKCYGTDAEFVALCQQIYKGNTSGGRCFFVPNATVTLNWTDAFALCERFGGTMAQIHTGDELKTIAKYLKTVRSGENYYWIASKRDPNAAGTYFLDLQKSRWYTSATEYYPNLTGGNTWIKTHQTDDRLLLNSDCHHIWKLYTWFGDWPCSDQLYVFCQISNPSQNYTFFENTCLYEQVVESFASSTSINCAKQCDTFSWCRSFNFWTNTETCELFPWSARDNPNSTATEACLHYTFDQ